MKTKAIILVVCLMSAASLFAVPAYRGWQTKAQPDGTIVEVRLNGDEHFHYWTNQNGEVVEKSADGYWRVKETTAEQLMEKRKKAPKRSAQPKKVGTINLAPRGLFILVNFKDTKFQSSNTQAEMNKMMNADNYTHNGAYGSAKKYFSDQSNGAYVPTFDVVGPVTLSKNCSYYGANDSEGNDKYPADMVVEACKLADTQCGVDFTLYDNDNDGYVDFVYIIYAGKGEADGGDESTIWPHNWDISSTIYYGFCTYKKSDCKVDGLYINNYACSGELNGYNGTRNGIGTLCHEFSHVLGLPDYYDTNYGSNSEEMRIPGDWDIMASGSYNGDGNYPPNYSAHEKYFFGWQTPVNPSVVAQVLTLNAVGSPNAETYQINNAGTLQAATYGGVNYYIENRQQTGWDTYLPGHGLLIWYVNYNATKWKNNEPNDTDGDPCYTVISATGNKTGIGTDKDPFPGTNSVTQWNGLSARPLSNIKETGGVVSLAYIKDPNSSTFDYEVAFENAMVPSESGTINREAPLQIAIMPDPGYVITSGEHLEITMGGQPLAYGVDYIYANNTLTIPSVTGDIEIYVMPLSGYKVTWIANGEIIEVQGYSAGALLRLPTTQINSCEGMQLVGWTAEKNYYDPFALPSDLVTEASSHRVTTDLILYAVYKE